MVSRHLNSFSPAHKTRENSQTKVAGLQQVHVKCDFVPDYTHVEFGKV